MTDAEIYDRLRMDLMRYATALVGVSDAGDLVSSVVTRALGRRGGLSGLEEPKPYLMKSLLNEARMRHRSAQRQGRIVATMRPGNVAAGYDHTLDLIMGLPAQQRAAVYLTYYEQYTASEAAEAMGCRPATVRRYLHLAREKLKAVIDE